MQLHARPAPHVAQHHTPTHAEAPADAFPPPAPLRRYKSYFRWQHYPYKTRADASLVSETEACPSVTTAFLQVGGAATPATLASPPGAALLQPRRPPGRPLPRLTTWRLRPAPPPLLPQVLQELHAAEALRTGAGPRRNVLQLLASNTRKTKVVDLAFNGYRSGRRRNLCLGHSYHPVP